MVSEMLTETKKSPVMNYEALQFWRAILIFTFWLVMLEGKAEKGELHIACPSVTIFILNIKEF